MILTITKLLMLTFIFCDIVLTNEDVKLHSPQKIEEANKLQSADKKPFIPTHEWQVVEQDQAVPPGLHMRLNLQTGVNEAKLMDSKDTKSAEQLPAIVHSKSDPTEPEDSARNRLNRAEVLEALKSFKAGMDDVKTEQKEFDKSKFRSYEELKTDFQKMNVAVKTDQEIIQGLLKEYNDSQTLVDRRLVILEDLEYYLHQIDNAMYFSDSGGILLLIQDLISSKCTYKSEVLHAFGSAVQGSGKVQVEAFKSGALGALLNLLKQEAISEKLLNRIVYSLSTFLRHFPLAQREFLKLGGFQELSRLLSLKNPQSNAPIISKKIRLKIITLVSDLSEEKKNQESISIQSDLDISKKKQYQLVNLEQLLLAENWCSHILDHLSEATQQSNDHDYVEKMLVAFESILPTCKVIYKSQPTHAKDLLDLVLDMYKQSDDEYFAGFRSSAHRIKKDLGFSEHRVDL